jgi:hypothetical protein
MPTTPMALEMPDPALEDEWLSALGRRLFWYIGLTFGLIGAFTARFSMNPDGISYLDLGYAFLNRDWNAAFNGYWSPLYAVLLGALIRTSHVSPYWESTIVHTVNFLLFVASMAAVEMFLSELCRRHRTNVSAGEESAQPVPVWAMQAFGYSLFLCAGLVWISVDVVTPDQGVAVLMYLVAALLLQMQTRNRPRIEYALLGILLGVGYLTKAALFPLGLVSLATTPFLSVSKDFHGRLVRALIAASLFALVASPLVIVLSREKGRFTFGDVGKLAYAAFVDRHPDVTKLKHPVRKIFSNPSVYEFAAPVGGTYPPFYDASYWLDGTQSHLDIGGQIRALEAGMRVYIALAIEQGGFVVAFVSLLVLDWKAYSFRKGVAATWPAWLAVLVGLGMYLLVLVETRYVASFLVIVGMCAFGGIRLLPSVRTKRVLIGLSLGVAIVALLDVAKFTTQNLYASVTAPRNTQWEIAQALWQKGIRPGDGVATIVNHRRFSDYWAHLAQVRIIEDIPPEEMSELMSLNSESRAELLRVMRESGAKAIVTTLASPGDIWERLGNSEYFVFPLIRESLP